MRTGDNGAVQLPRFTYRQYGGVTAYQTDDDTAHDGRGVSRASEGVRQKEYPATDRGLQQVHKHREVSVETKK